jgi:O-antigen ligase
MTTAIDTSNQRIARTYPWLASILFGIIFFVGTHHMVMTQTLREDSFGKSSAALETESKEGNPYRRIGFAIWGAYAAVSLVRAAPERFRLSGPAWWVTFTYVAFTLLSVGWSDELGLSTKRAFIFFVNWIAAIAVIRRHGLESLLKLAVATSGAYLLIGVGSELLLGTLQPFSADYRFAGTSHPNHQGLNCAVLFLGCCFTARCYPRYKAFFVALAGVALVFLVLTKSRTAVGSCLAVFALQEVVLARRKGVLVYCGAICVVVAAFLYMSMGASQHVREIALLGRGGDSAGELTGRVPLWRSLMPFVYKQPVFGYGFGGFWNPTHIRAVSAANDWGIGESHSSYMENLLAGGVIGLGLLVLLFVSSAIMCWRRYVREGNVHHVFAMAIIVFAMIDAFTESAIVSPITLSFFLNLSIIAASAVYAPWKRPERTAVQAVQPMLSEA